jgi:hypothetical protein
VGIGTATVNRGQLQIASGSNAELHLTGSGQTGSGEGMTITSNSTEGNIWYRNNGYFRIATNNTERMRIDSSGNLLVGKTVTTITTQGAYIESTGKLLLTTSSNSTNLATASGGRLSLCNPDTTNNNFSHIGGYNSNGLVTSQIDFINVNHASRTGAIAFLTHNGSTMPEAMRIDSNGNLLVGTTDSTPYNNSADSTADNGFAVTNGIFSAAKYQATANTSFVASLNRTGTDGPILQLRRSGTTVGVVGASSSDVYIGTGDAGVRFQDGSDAIVPFNTTTLAASDNVLSLGGGSSRFKDLYLSGYAYASYFAGQSDTNTYVHFPGSDVMQFNTGGSERARVDASGLLLVGKTVNGIAVEGHEFGPSGYAYHTRSGGTALYLNRLTSDGDILDFRRSGSLVGSVSVTTSGTTYNTTSDLRLKENIEPLVATDKLMQMNPVSYNWKADPDGPRSMGFIAQEMQEVMPEAVAVGDDEDAMMSMDYGRITPILVSALQDAHRKIEQLEQRIADMEAK